MNNKTTIIVEPPNFCPHCGLVLPADSPQGLCSRCLLARAVAGPDSTAPPPTTTPPGQTLPQVGGYELHGVIAQGGMGIVYRARDLRLQRTVALKMMSSGPLATPAEVERFKVETEAAARLEHPNIVPIYEVGEVDGRHFFTMKLVEGTSLSEAKAKGALPARRAATLLAKVARAVHYAHQRGVLHRDIKPNNILLDDKDEPQLTDFGLAKIVDRETSLTRSLTVLGTLSYMSPEQARGESKQLTTAADIYSLGAVLYETLTGRPPFEGQTSMDVLRAVIEREPRSPRAFNAEVPRDLETICLKCLEKDPGKRYGTALELAEELERFLRNEPIAARPTSSRERVLKWVRRKPAVAGLLTVIVAVAAGGFLAVLWQLRQTHAALHLAQQNALAEATARAPIVRTTQVLRHELPVSPRPIVSACFSPDGRYILTASQDETAALWDATDGNLIRKFEGHSGVLASAVFSADGRRVLTYSFDKHFRYACLNPAGEPRLLTTSHKYGDQSVRLWDVASGDAITIITNDTAQMSAAVLSPDGTLIATAGYDNLARIWDAETGKLLHTLSGHKAAILDLQFTPDSRQLLTTSDGSCYQLKFQKGPNFSSFSGGSSSTPEREIVHIWDVQTGRQVGSLRNQAAIALFGPANSRTRARVSPDGKWIVTAPAEIKNLGIWNARNGKLRKHLGGHKHEVNDAVFSVDARLFATLGSDNTARLWETDSGRERAVLIAHEGSILAGAFSPDGRRFATGSADGTVRVWESETGKGMAVLKGHDGKIFTVAFSPDGTRIISAGEDGTARVWPAATLEQLSIPLLTHRGDVHQVQFSKDGRRLVTASTDRTARVWEVPTGRPVSILQGHSSLAKIGARESILGDVECASFSPDGRYVATASDDQDAVLVSRYSLGWLVRPGPPATWPPAGTKTVPFSPGRIFETETGRELLGLPGDGCGLNSIAFSPDGRRVLTASNGRQRRAAIRMGGGSTFGSSGNKKGPLDVQLWDAKTGALVATLGGHTNLIRFALFSPDGTRILTADQSRIRLWDASSGTELPPLQKPAQSTYASFGPDSKYILADDWGKAAIWSVATGQQILQFKEQAGQINFATFSPDGTKVALGGRFGVGALCQAEDGKLLMNFSGKKGAITYITFSPDGRLLVVLDGTREVRIFDTVTGQPAVLLLATLDAHKDSVLHAAFSPDGKWLATASKDYTARLWPISALPLKRITSE